MKKTGFILLVFSISLSGCFTNKTIHPEKNKMIDELIQANVNSLKPFSGSVLVAKEGQIVYRGAFGNSNLEKGTKNKIDSKYFIGSLTKKFTTVAILQLVEKGQLNLDDTLDKWLPEVKDSDKITIHHLLSHQSGLRRDSYQDYDKNASPLERVLSVKNDTLNFTPGTKSEYSNVGFYALTHIIEQESGMSYDAYFKKYIFHPIKLSNTGVRQYKGQNIQDLSIGIQRAPDKFGVDDFAHAAYFDSYSLGGGGSLYSTVDDLYKFHVAVEEGVLLSKSSIDLMKKRWTLTEEPRPFNTYGWEVWDYSKSESDPMLIYGFSGRIFGYKAMHRYYKKDHIVVIVLTNSEYSERSLLGHSIRNILLHRDYKLPEAAPKKIPLSPSMNKHVGVYDFPSEKTTVEIKIINEKMTLTSHGDRPMYIYPADENTFYSNLIPLKITFEKTDKDKTQKLEFNHSNEFVKTIERIK